MTDIDDFNKIKEQILRKAKLDCQYYRDSYLQRRISSRMRHVDVNDYAQYLDYLAKHPEEFKQLMDALTINVTNFFRDPDIFGFIERNVLPDIEAV